MYRVNFFFGDQKLCSHVYPDFDSMVKGINRVRQEYSALGVIAYSIAQL